MAVPHSYGIKIAWGVVEPKPLQGVPCGKVRLRMRNNNVVRGFVRTPLGIKHFAVKDCGDHWEPIWQGENATITKTPKGIELVEETKTEAWSP